MAANFYWLGILLAISSGTSNHLGTVFQKKVINELPDEAKFFRSLVKKRLWLSGLILQYGLGAILYMSAQFFIGPALIPGFMASGLIVLAIGSIKIVGETLNKAEILGIILMIMAFFLLGLSELSIEIATINLLEFAFLLRIVIFTLVVFLFCFVCYFLQRENKRFKGILLATLSGLLFVLSNFWVSPMIGVIAKIFSATFNLGELFLFIISCVILILSNVFGVMTIQKSFIVGQASNLVPIQQVPTLLAPIAIYFLIFLLTPPSVFSIYYLIIGITLIIISSFLLGKRSALMEDIK
ncbi:MAG: hypothetical protein ACFE75_02755 [Candidatus Hodarchaeota archaeon]